jgi:hypothetical protein
MLWYYHRDGAQMGPVSWQELVVSARAGGLGASDLVWTEGMAQWQAAATIPGLLPPRVVPVQAPAAPPSMPPVRPAPAPPPAQTVYTAPLAAQPAPAVMPRPAAAAPAPRPAYARPPAPAASPAPKGWVFVPAGWSGWAVASGYLGLLSILGYPAVVSLIVSLIALRDLRKHPEKQGRRRAWFGLVMGALGTIAVAVIVGFHLIANLPEPR